jgi:hypothetical protein
MVAIDTEAVKILKRYPEKNKLDTPVEEMGQLKTARKHGWARWIISSSKRQPTQVPSKRVFRARQFSSSLAMVNTRRRKDLWKALSRLQQKPIRLILAGAGQRGKQWAQVAYDEPDCEVVAYVDVDEENLTWAGERFAAAKGMLFTDLGQALRSMEADAVILAIPPMVRYEQCLQVIEQRLPMLAEKPLTELLQALQNCVPDLDYACVTPEEANVVVNTKNRRGPPANTRLLLEAGFASRYDLGTGLRQYIGCLLESHSSQNQRRNL